MWYILNIFGVMRKGMLGEKTHHTSKKQPKMPKVLSGPGGRKVSKEPGPAITIPANHTGNYIIYLSAY